MKRLVCLALLAISLAVPALVFANDDDLTGSWRLTVLAPEGNTETTNFVFKLAIKDDKPTATVVVSSPQMIMPEVTAFTTTGDEVRLAVTYTTGKDGKGAAKAAPKKGANPSQVFIGHITDGGKKIVGVVSKGGKKNGDAVGPVTPAYMVPTDWKELEPTDIARRLPADELQSWAEIASKMAKEHKSPWAAQINTQFATIFLAKKNPALAVRYANEAEKLLSATAAPESQLPVLELVAKALTAAGRADDLAVVNERLAKLEKILDDDFLIKVPPFKGQPFEGRKVASDRTVVMELFTGAQCNPCIAADVAFDVLQKTYSAKEVILLQYHLHIPGPDPMTNADTEARAAYYGARSTPSTFFNGISKAGGGGGMDAAEKKYETYRRVIDPLLENPAECKITASAKRVGTTIQMQADVAELQKPGKKIKLRTVLVEETVRYTGSNKLRFHHQVVRAIPSTPDGVAVTEPALAWKATLELPQLRKTFVDYLDNYAANVREFPRPARPMAMDQLRLVAFVQDDATQEILQAVMVDVAQ